MRKALLVILMGGLVGCRAGKAPEEYANFPSKIKRSNVVVRIWKEDEWFYLCGASGCITKTKDFKKFIDVSDKECWSRAGRNK